VSSSCGAVREDEQLGLEATPQDFVEALCQVFDEVWRVLKDDGTIWVNLGDSYSSFRDSKAVPDSLRNGDGTAVSKASNRNPEMLKASGLKHKDLIGIPWRFAFAMQDRGWYLRQDIIWAKPNPMPESVTDRCTKSHEYIFLMTKNPKYFYDHEAIKVPVKDDWGTRDRSDGKYHKEGTGLQPHTGLEKSYSMANKRSVWSVTTSRYKDAHFATYPPELISPCILAGSKEGDTVLDPFSGSGTTGEVALQNNRHYIGLELNPEYAELSRKRLSEAVGMFGDVTIR
jgi:DNA modification methylase